MQLAERLSMISTTPIEGVWDAVFFLKNCVYDFKLNINPDESFGDYIDLETKKPTFTKEDAELMDKRMNECRDVLTKEHYDIYRVCTIILLQGLHEAPRYESYNEFMMITQTIMESTPIDNGYRIKIANPKGCFEIVTDTKEVEEIFDEILPYFPPISLHEHTGELYGTSEPTDEQLEEQRPRYEELEKEWEGMKTLYTLQELAGFYMLHDGGDRL